jgi:hypothetical protein
MDQRPRGKPGPPRGVRPRPVISQATYWRRRAVVLVLGIGLLSGLGWTVNGVLAASSSAGQASPPTGPSTVDSIPAHLPTRPASPAHPAHTPSPLPTPTLAPTRHGRTRGVHAAGRTAACAAGTVTLRLYSPQWFYQAGKMPRFTVRAVYAGTRPCRFNMGTRFVSVVVAARRPVWSSADCPPGHRWKMTVLSTGRPAVLHVLWDRKTASPGCAGAQRPARPGEYKVTAVAGRLHSAKWNLVLGAPGAIGP